MLPTQGPDVYFQMVEAAAHFHRDAPAVVEKVMNEFAELTGRQYSLFDYHGDLEAIHVVVCMGMSAKVVETTVSHMVARRGDKVRDLDSSATCAARDP